MRPIGRKRGYSESASNTPLIPIKPSAAPKRSVAHRQRGYSDASSFSDYTATSPALPTCPSQIIKKDMIAQYPAGPGGNPKLDNSALQGIWDIYRKEAGDYDAAMIDSWNASIDNLILFVSRITCCGLSSALILFHRPGYSQASSPRSLLNLTRVSHRLSQLTISQLKTIVELLVVALTQPELTPCGLPVLA